MWTPYDTISASLLLLDDPPYDERLVATLLDDLRIYQDERQEIYQRAILAEHKLHFSEVENARLRKQLPANMESCTILFHKCEKGHSWLTAANWKEDGCLCCENVRLREQLEVLQAELDEQGSQIAALLEGSA